MASSQIEQLRKYYESLSVSQKEEFIGKLRKEVDRTQSPTHVEFLKECILNKSIESNNKANDKRNEPIIINNNFYKNNPNSNNTQTRTTQNIENYNYIDDEDTSLKQCTPSLVLSIVGLVFALLIPLVTFICSTISLVMSIQKRHTHKTLPSTIMSIVGLAVAFIVWLVTLWVLF